MQINNWKLTLKAWCTVFHVWKINFIAYKLQIIEMGMKRSMSKCFLGENNRIGYLHGIDLKILNKYSLYLSGWRTIDKSLTIHKLMKFWLCCFFPKCINRIQSNYFQKHKIFTHSSRNNKYMNRMKRTFFNDPAFSWLIQNSLENFVNNCIKYFIYIFFQSSKNFEVLYNNCNMKHSLL